MDAINPNIVTHPARGSSRPVRKLPVAVDISPTNQGIVAPPIPASANMIAPIRRDLRP